MPILLLAIIFGLSMDYEVFLPSRIRERYDQAGDNTAAVAAGLQRTGGRAVAPRHCPPGARDRYSSDAAVT